MYELLPQYPAVWDEKAGREIELTALRPSRYAARFASDGRGRTRHSRRHRHGLGRDPTGPDS